MNNELFNALMVWDGWGKGYREKMYDRFAEGEHLVEDLIQICENYETLRPAAAWLLRYHTEQKNKIEEQDIVRIVESVQEDEHWWSRASALRVISMGMQTKDTEKRIVDFVRRHMKSKKIALRAFAYDAMGVLAFYNSDYLEETKEACEKAMQDEKPAVYVRARNALKLLDKK